MAQGSVEEALFAMRRSRERQLLTRLEASELSNLLIKLGNSIEAFAAGQTKHLTDNGGTPERQDRPNNGTA